MFLSVNLVLARENQILLLKRQNTGFEDGQYGLIAGHVEKEESIIQALIREAKEESGIRLSPEQLNFFHVMQRFTINDRVYLDFFFSAESWDGEIINQEPEKCSALTWFPLNHLPDNMIPYIKHTLQHYLFKSIYFSELGQQGHPTR
ncbi:MAG: NUDIX domain-containing protein [Thermodesulfobacteriota bacterium]